MLDSVRVSPETFTSVLFLGAEPRKEFTPQARPDRDRPQKHTADGLPVWSVKVVAMTWHGKTDTMNVSVPMRENPADRFVVGQPVELRDPVYGVSGKRGGGFVTWFRAEGLEPSGRQAPA